MTVDTHISTVSFLGNKGRLYIEPASRHVVGCSDTSKVAEVAEHLTWVTEEWFKSRYLWLQDPDFSGRFSHDDVDFSYHWYCIA